MVKDRFLELELKISQTLVVIEPVGVVLVPYVMRFVVGPVKVGGFVDGATPGVTVEVVGTVPRAINTLPVVVPLVDEACIVVVGTVNGVLIWIDGRLAPLAA